MRISFGWLVLALPLLTCTSVTPSHLPRCEPAESLSPLPDLACRADPQTVAFRGRLRESMGSDVGPLFVRAMLDEASRVQSLCTDSTRIPRGWRAEQNLAERLSEFAEVPGGPACLANRRLDLNRRAAKLAEIKRQKAGCMGELGTITKGGKGLTGPQSSTVTAESSACINQGADWVQLDPGGLKHPLIFAQPEVSDLPAVSAQKIRQKCFRLRDFKKRESCIVDYGWELLE